MIPTEHQCYILPDFHAVPNGLGSNVKSSSRVWMMLISSVATFFLLCFNSDPSMGTIPYACNNLTMTTSELVASTIGVEYRLIQLHIQYA